MTDITLAVIGSGFMGSLYARIVGQMPGVRIAAVHDMDASRAEGLAASVQAHAYSGDYRQIWDHEPDVQGVLICTPETAHVAPARSAIEAGKHVMVEKPLTTSPTDAQSILDAPAAQPDVITMMGYSLRFDPRYHAMKQAVAKGQIGDVIHMFARRNMPEGVLLRLAGRVEAPYWVGVHDLDMMHWLTGSRVVAVMAVATDRGMVDWNVKSVYYALLTFEDGTVAALETAWSPRPLAGRPQAYTFRVEGTHGQLQVRSYEQGITIFGEQTMTEPDTYYMPEIYGQIGGVYRDQIAYFVDCIRKRQPSDIPLANGFRDVQIADAILRSAAEHREIRLD